MLAERPDTHPRGRHTGSAFAMPTMIGRKLRSSCPPGGSIAVTSGLPSSSRNVRNSGISR